MADVPLQVKITDIVDLPTAEMDDTLVLAPDGAGGVEFRAETGGAGAPGTELDYAQLTTTVSVTSTTEGTETNILSGNSVTFDGGAYWFQFYCPRVALLATAANRGGIGVLYIDGTTQGRIALEIPTFVSGVTTLRPVNWLRKLSPSAGAHTAHIKGWKSTAGETFDLVPGAGGAGTEVPAFLRITKA